MPTWSPDDESIEREYLRDPGDVALRDRIKSLMVACWPRWLSPFEIEMSLVARRVPRTMREMLEDDRKLPEHLRQFEEKEVPNAKRGKHKVYRVIVRAAPPTLF